jgi:hypothetical protein
MAQYNSAIAAAPTLPTTPGSGCLQLHFAATTTKKWTVSHLHPATTAPRGAHEQDGEPVKQQRVDAEEVRGRMPCAWAREFSPARSFAARCGVDAGPFQDRPHGAGRKLVAEAGNFALDPPITQIEFSDASCSTSWRSSGAVERPPVRRRRGWVQRRVTRSRCHRKIVAG